MARFTELPLVVYGGPEGPSSISAPLPPWILGKPSKAIKPVHRIERYWPSVRVRMFFAAEGGMTWLSPGYHTLSLRVYVVAKLRSKWRRWREPIPAARVVP